jgi:putative NADH-flavin reductase
MKLLIFGATGRTGKPLVNQALEQGHHVSAFVRSSGKLGINHPNLEIIEGNILNANQVSAAVKGKDVVLSALGIDDLKPNTVLSDATAICINAMNEHGIKRFICETSIGLGDSEPQMGFFFGKIVIPFFLKYVWADKQLQEKFIMQSNLDWIIARPSGLIDGEKTGKYKVGFVSTDHLSMRITRADVADFMLKQLSDNTYLRKAVSISN